MVGEAIEQLFQAAPLSAQWVISSVVFDTVDHVILYQLRNTMPRENFNKHVDQYLKAIKASEAVGKKLLFNNQLLAPIASSVQIPTREAIANPQRVEVIGSMFMATGAN